MNQNKDDDDDDEKENVLYQKLSTFCNVNKSLIYRCPKTEVKKD